MDKWFKLFDEWIITKHYQWSDVSKKELWQLFTIDVKSAWNIKEKEKVQWMKLNYNKTAKKIGCCYVDEDGWVTADEGLSSCFKWKN